MHPAIKEYWEKFHGKEVTLNKTGHFYEVVLESQGCIIIAMQYQALKVLDSNGKAATRDNLSPLKDGDWVYPFNGHLNDEAKMLRLLNLRAFF